MNIFTTPLRTSRPGKPVGEHWEWFSPRLQREITAESNAEHDFYTLIDTNPDVEIWCEQPIRVEAAINGKRHSSILDVWVKHCTGTEYFWEVKEDKALAKAHRDPGSAVGIQLEVQKRWSAQTTSNYGVVTANRIRTNNVYLTNKKLIRTSVTSSRNIDFGDLPVRIQRSVSQSRRTLGDIVRIFHEDPKSYVEAAIMKALYWGLIQADLNQHLSQKTMITVYEKPNQSNFDSGNY